MASFRQILLQIVIRTKYNLPALNTESSYDLYGYIAGIITNKKCKVYKINGVEDHIHIICDLHPSIALADLVKDIKVYSNFWIKKEGSFPLFKEWAIGYGAFSYSLEAKRNLVRYVENQKEHHRKVSFEAEYKYLLRKHGIEFDPDSVFKD